MMGQSDTESTCSSIRVNPGSPRDPSVLLDEAEGSLSLSFGHEFPLSPSSSSGDSGEMGSSVIVRGHVPKRACRGNIPVIDLTSDNDEQPGQEMAHPLHGHIAETLSDVQGITERNSQRLQGQRRRVACVHHCRCHHRRSPPQCSHARIRRPCPYFRRERSSIRDRNENGITVSSPPPMFAEDGDLFGATAQDMRINENPTAIQEEETTIVIDDEDEEPSLDREDLGARSETSVPQQSFDSDIFRRLQEAQERTQNSIERARRLTQEVRRSIEIVERTRPNCHQSDEVIARRLQDRYDRENTATARHHGRSVQDTSSLLSRVSGSHSAAPVAPSFHYQRRRMNRPLHFTGPDTVPDLLLPFVSVVSLQPPAPLNLFDPSEDYEDLWNLSERLGPAKSRGLSKEAIDQIPSYRYSANSKDLSNSNCVICMMGYSNREKLRRLKCDHNYHSKCIDRWLKNNRTCPVCRSEVNP